VHVISRDVVFRDRYGLHPRSAHRIGEALAGTTSRVTIEPVATNRPPIDARSMLALISSGIQAGDPVRVAADGPDEEVVLAKIAALLESGVCHP
jgi:phosphotransferase system HPr (HPr) family protein